MSLASRRARAEGMRGRRAGLISRVMAGGIDLAVSGIILFSILVAFGVVRYMIGLEPLGLPSVSGIFTAVAYPFVEFVYLSVTWSKNGSSVGKKLFGLRAVRADGAPLGTARATARAGLCTLFGGISLLWCVFSSKNAAVHDLVLHTAVVYDWSDEIRTDPEVLAFTEPAAVAVMVIGELGTAPDPATDATTAAQPA